MRGASSFAMGAMSVAIAAVMVLGSLSGMSRISGASRPPVRTLSSPGPVPHYAGTGLPSLDPDDAKFFGVAGTGIQTLSGVKIVLYVGVPSGSTSFSVGLFDGDVGGSWDDGSTPFSYRLWKDPMKNGTTAMPLDTIASSQASDDAWYDKSYATDDEAKAPSGNYFYRMEAAWTSGTPTGDFNNFKVRSSGQVSVRAGQDFGFVAGPQNTAPGGDPWVGSGDPHPGDQNDPGANSYDGQFTYYFYVPKKLPSITFWDGDNDRADDTDDPNTPNTDPDGPGPAVAEGVNEGAPGDGPSPYGTCCDVAPSIYYDILDPENHLYTNSNPSGNTEWERFVVGDAASDPDILVSYELQPGLWRYRVQGMDAHNLNVLRSTYEIYSNTDLPLTVNPSPSVYPDHILHTHDAQTIYYAHTVKNNGALDDFSLVASSGHGWATAIYADSNGNGVLDPGEPQITQTGPMAPGQELPILVELQIPDLPSGTTDILSVTASSTTEWAVQGTATDTTTTNSPPNAVLTAPGAVPEGASVRLNATGSSDPDGDSLEYRWDFEGDGVWDTDWGSDATISHTWGDDIVVNPTVEVRDAEFTAENSTQIAVLNVAPSAEVSMDAGLSEGTPFSLTVHVTDPGSDDIALTVDFGDGTALVPMQYCDSMCPDPLPSPDVHPVDFTFTVGHVYGDNAAFSLHVSIVDDDGGVWDMTEAADVSNLIPAVSLVEGASYVFDEGQGLSLQATATDPGSDDLTFAWDFGDGNGVTHVFFNDGIGPDPAVSPGGTFPFTATDSASHVYGDNGDFVSSLTVTDDDGGSVRIERSVTVRNVPPTIDSFDAYAYASFRLRVAGEKWHDVRLSIEGNGVELAGVGVTRYPGSPDVQSATIPLTQVSLLSAVRVVLYYTPDDDPVNGQRNGANPVWVFITLADGRELRLHHTFNVQHPSTWVWEPGAVMPFLASAGVTVEATASDPGSDDLTFRFEYGDGTMAEETVFNNGVSPDPYPSTEVNPITATVRMTHAYASGTFTLIITVMDDDGGVVSVAVTLSF